MFHVDFIFIGSFKSHQTSGKRRRDISFVWQTHFLVSPQIHTTLSCHITSGHVRQSSPIKFISLFRGKKLSSLSCCQFNVCWIFVPESVCEGECKWRNKRSSSWKEVLGCVLFVSEVYPEGWKFVKRIKKYEKEWDATLHAKQLAPDTRICAHVSVFVWPVHAQWVKCVTVYYCISHLGRLYRQGCRFLSKNRCQFKILIKDLSQPGSCFWRFSCAQEKINRNYLLNCTLIKGAEIKLESRDKNTVHDAVALF